MATVGKRGQGPDEYLFISDDYIDEFSDFFCLKLFSYIPKGAVVTVEEYFKDGLFVFLDKRTLEGYFFDFLLEEYGIIDKHDTPPFRNGYYARNIYAYTLKQDLNEEVKKTSKHSTEKLKRIKELNQSISEDNNNILFVRKLK